MEGSSLLSVYNDNRYVISAGPAKMVKIAGRWQLVDESPPFYSIGSIALISCDTWYLLHLSEHIWESGRILDSNSVCTPIGEDQAFKILVRHLRERGFDTSTIDNSWTPNSLELQKSLLHRPSFP